MLIGHKFKNVSSKVSDNEFLLFWDFDEHEFDLDQLMGFVYENDLEIHIIKTTNGFHFIDFHFYSFEEIESLNQKLKDFLPSTYPTLKEIKEEDLEREQEFFGQTLRITPKSFGDLTYVSKIGSSKRKFSPGHVDLYEKLTSQKLEVFGISTYFEPYFIGYLPKTD